MKFRRIKINIFEVKSTSLMCKYNTCKNSEEKIARNTPTSISLGPKYISDEIPFALPNLF